jgi:hypothetical protein
MIVDVRCSPQFAKPQDIKGSESSQKLQTLEKRQKQLQGDIEVLQVKEGVLRDVLVAYASSDGFDFAESLTTFDVKKAEVRIKLEGLQEELANVEQQIREVGVGQPVFGQSVHHSLTGRMPPVQQEAMLIVDTVKITIETEETCEVSLHLTTRTFLTPYRGQD